MKRYLLLIIAALLSFTLFACVEETTTMQTTIDSTASIPTTSASPWIFLQEDEITLPLGASLALPYQANVSVEFASSNPEIVSVRLDGVIEGVAAGEATIYLRYLDFTYTSVQIIVVDDCELISPYKTVYGLSEPLDLSGAKIIFYDGSEIAVEIPLTMDMISGYDSEVAGMKQLTVTYLGVHYYMEVYVMNAKQQASLFSDFIVINQTISQYELVEFALMKYDLDEFFAQIESVYDYEEITISALIETPSRELDEIKAFWMQPYLEQVTPGALNPSRNLEGLVTQLDDDYDLVLNYVEDGNPGYQFRYLPRESGTYEMVVEIVVDDVKIQTFGKTFTVLEANHPRSGYITIDETNNRHFMFETGETYLPVGQNVGWYTSQDRKVYDYRQWFQKMNEAGMDYARIWLSAWGFSPFWDDVVNFDSRQSNLQSLDTVLALAEEYGIHLQITILHHGMFSRFVNPMWPGSTNTWYTNKYGANPYGEYLDTPGKFFTDDWAKQTFKNQLDYLVARYGYSDNILAWELMNETDWIEDYGAVIGSAWHAEMAGYLHEIDPNHLVTTSFKSDSFYTSNFNVFNLEQIDYVNVHRYGVTNHLTYLPQYQQIAFNIFEKPILYSEIGLEGNGGAQQLAADPLNISLHQGLWGGIMGGGAGSGMNWWWDSWIHQGNAYAAYAGAASYAKLVNLTGANYTTLRNLSGITISRADVDLQGYLVDNRLYAYLYDEDFTYTNPETDTKQSVVLTIPMMAPGNYTIRYYDTVTGAEIGSDTLVQLTSGTFSLTLPDFTNDIALIAESNQE